MLNRRIAELEQELTQMQSRASAAEAAALECRNEVDELRGLFASIEAFGLPLTDTQNRQKTLAEDMNVKGIKTGKV